MGKKVLLAMSGGIDSSAAAVILKENGYDVTGFTFRIKGVTSDAVERASSLCDKLSIPHIYSDITSEFYEKVVQYFKTEYEKGRTPNPCIRCNREIKFGLIFDYAMSNGFDYASTGHYASIINKDGHFFLGKAIDDSRDQTYFLYVLKEDQLKHILFPLNGVPKSEARMICSNAGLLPADSKESREICFVPENYKIFLTEKLGADSKSGNFISVNGEILGKHNGILNYTIGQRKGLGIHLGKPGYIVSINPLNGNIKIGEESDLYTNEFVISEISLVNGQIPKSDLLYVKIRYSALQTRITNLVQENGVVKITTQEPMRAVTPGQSAVIYNGDIVVGGGVIL
ncbi:MAG: tRNA 2-thiouridine(34) synthase MnmA [Clostridiales bacterium]|nr:tRNA 2-thiouridine(34) synthase MnmA [Clostridiales bacterium]